MSKMPCKKYLSDSKNKKNKRYEASAWKLLKISPSNKKKIHICRGTHHIIFATGPLIPSYATV
jgi:hypothetical protein